MNWDFWAWAAFVVVVMCVQSKLIYERGRKDERALLLAGSDDE